MFLRYEWQTGRLVTSQASPKEPYNSRIKNDLLPFK